MENKVIPGKTKLTYEERIRWFIQNYYETGMEYSCLLVSMKDEDLDSLEWYGEKISIPQYREEIFPAERNQADQLLARYEDDHEHHFHQVDREWIIDCMIEFKRKGK
jgi:hypothetical protein